MKKIGRFGSLAGGAPFGRQPLQLNRTVEREAESAADQAPFNSTSSFDPRKNNLQLITAEFSFATEVHAWPPIHSVKPHTHIAAQLN
jgi:hypothetical protein